MWGDLTHLNDTVTDSEALCYNDTLGDTKAFMPKNAQLNKRGTLLCTMIKANSDNERAEN